MFILYLHPVRPSQSPLIYGVLHSLQEAICAFKDFIKGMPSALNWFFDTNIYVLYGNVKAFCLACRRLRFVFYQRPLKLLSNRLTYTLQ